MPKIQSRPEEDVQLDGVTLVIGDGENLLRVTDEELELITAYLYVTRLGKPGIYKAAAFSLSVAISDALGDDFSEEAYNNVMPTISIEDSQGNTVRRLTDDEDFVLELEV